MKQHEHVLKTLDKLRFVKTREDVDRTYQDLQTALGSLDSTDEEVRGSWKAVHDAVASGKVRPAMSAGSLGALYDYAKKKAKSNAG